MSVQQKDGIESESKIVNLYGFAAVDAIFVVPIKWVRSLRLNVHFSIRSLV
jgi:hypothetical protein